VHAKTFHFLSLSVALGIALFMPILAFGENPEKVARIGYQKSGAFLLVKNEGSLEKRLPAFGLASRMEGIPVGTAVARGIERRKP